MYWLLKIFVTRMHLVACYQDDDITRQVAADFYREKLSHPENYLLQYALIKSGDGIEVAAVEKPGPLVRRAIMARQLIRSLRCDSPKSLSRLRCTCSEKRKIIYNKAYGNY